MLVLVIAAPTIVKSTHIFNHHKHEVCEGLSEAHLHKLDVDCSFYKFKVNTPFTITFNNFHFLQKVENFTLIESQYHFINEYQRLQFSLRGPPKFV